MMKKMLEKYWRGIDMLLMVVMMRKIGKCKVFIIKKIVMGFLVIVGIGITLMFSDEKTIWRLSGDIIKG
jgi:hypothetical protein